MYDLVLDQHETRSHLSIPVGENGQGQHNTPNTIRFARSEMCRLLYRAICGPPLMCSAHQDQFVMDMQLIFELICNTLHKNKKVAVMNS